MIRSSLSPSLKNASRLTRNVPLVRVKNLFPAGALNFASSSPPSRDGDEVESSSEHKSTSSNDDGLPPATDFFPWRHKSSIVRRLIPGTLEHKNQGLLLTSKNSNVYGNASMNSIVTAYMFLNVPWYELFWISHFQDELSSNMSWSFTQGIASLLSNLPLSGGGDHIPVESIITNHNDGTCEIDFLETIEISRSVENGAFRVRVVEGDGIVGEKSESSNIDSAIPLRRVFHEKAIELYQSSVNEFAKTNNNHSLKHSEEKQRLEIRLKMIPYDAEFVTLYAIPYLSRRNAKTDPELLTFYSKMLKESSTRRAPYLSRLRQENLENKGYMESTIIAQCMVWCEELFYIKDLSTGRILQGHEKHSDSTTPEMQKTPHLIRMERTVTTQRDPATGNFRNERENWIITDIDDLLGGNLVI